MRGRIVASLLLLLLAACSPSAPRILSTSHLLDTRDPTGPYLAEVVTTPLDGDDRVEIRWTVPGALGAFTAVRATAVSGRSDVFEAGIPGQSPGTTVRYFAAIVRDGRVVATDPPRAIELVGAVVVAARPLAAPDAALPRPDAGRLDAGLPAPDAGPVAPPPDAAPADPRTYQFRVLNRSGFCRADSDCLAGIEVCDRGTCRAFQGTCLLVDGGAVCPTGYTCTTATTPPACILAPRTCRDDTGCPTVDRCDPTRLVCVARTPCAVAADCPAGTSCDTQLGLCFAAP